MSRVVSMAAFSLALPTPARCDRPSGASDSASSANVGGLAQGPEEKRGFAGRVAGIVIPDMVSFQICAPRWGGVSHGRPYANPKKNAIGNDACPAGSCDDLQNDAGTCAAMWHKSGTHCSASVHAVEDGPPPETGRAAHPGKGGRPQKSNGSSENRGTQNPYRTGEVRNTGNVPVSPRPITFRQFADEWAQRACLGSDRRREKRHAIAQAILAEAHPRTLRAAMRVSDLAAASGVDKRLVRTILTEWTAAGLIEFRRGIGRGNWSTYRPTLRRPVQIVREGRA